MALYHLYLSSPIGPLCLESNGRAITKLLFQTTGCNEAHTLPVLRQAARQLEDYFAGIGRSFTVPLEPTGTPFQQKVWQALLTIPYGETRSYGDIARLIGQPRACRAVGMANHRNPLPIFIPCHRVVGANRSLTGYAGGLEIKQRLLAIETGFAYPQE